MGQGHVHDERPQCGEGQEAAELHPVRAGAGQQRGRDDAEHHLEGGEGHRRDREGVPGDWILRVGEAGELQPPDEAAAARTEGEGVAEQHPDDADDGEHAEALPHDGQDALAPDHPAVEERQPGRHEQHEPGTHEHPRGIAGVDVHLVPSLHQCARDHAGPGLLRARSLPGWRRRGRHFACGYGRLSDR